MRSHPLAPTLALALLLVATSPCAEELIDGIAAQVGSDIVLISEVTSVTDAMEEQMRAAGANDGDIDMVRSDMLERLIERRLVEQVVRRMELEATDAEIDQAVAGIAAENGLTLDQLRESLVDHDVSWEAYREKIRGEIQRSKILSGMVRSKVKIEETDVRALYVERFANQRKGGEEMHLRHLLVAGGEDTPRSHEEACDLVRNAHARIEAGQEFTELAREISDANARTGGDVGWVHQQDIAAWMADAVREVASGAVSPVIEMPFGCNLFQVVARRGFQPISYEEAEESLYGELFNAGLEREYEKWIDDLRTRTYIERKGVFAQAARLGGSGDPRDPTQVGGQGLAPLVP